MGPPIVMLRAEPLLSTTFDGVEIQPRHQSIVTLDSGPTVTWSWERWFLRVHSAFVRVAVMDNATRGTDMLKRVGRMVEGFLAGLAETAPNDLDCLALERSVMTVVLDLGLSMMKEVFRRADEQAPEVVVHGGRWGNRAVSKGTYTTKFGTLTLDRSGYQQAGRVNIQSRHQAAMTSAAYRLMISRMVMSNRPESRAVRKQRMV
jgi:hypothetical protein